MNLLNSVYEQAPIAMGVYLGKEHIIALANKMMLKAWGRTLEQVKDKPLFEAIPEVRNQGYEKIFQDVLSTGQPFRGNEMPAYLERNGKLNLAYFNIQYEPLRQDGQVIGIIQTAVEVTESVEARKRIELERDTIGETATRTEAERQSYILHDLFMNMPAMMAIVRGPDHVFELVNPVYQKIFPGRSLQGKPVLEALPEIKDQPISKILDNVYHTGESYVGNEVSVMLDRFDEGKLQPAYFNFIYKARQDYNGKINGIMVFGVDVTDLVEARNVLEKLALHSQSILEGISHIAWTADKQGRNTFLNRQWYDFTGSSKDLPAIESWKNHFHPDDQLYTSKKWQHSLSTGNLFEAEYRLRNANNEYRWVLGRALPSRNEAGEITQWVGTCTDIHEHKLLQENLQKLTQELAATNEELEASNEELSGANSQLTLINSDLDNFIYTASHDLKAPISNIEGLLSMLIRKLPSDVIGNNNIEKIMELMQSSIDRFKNTINDLTEITKIQKELGEDVAAINVTEIIKEVNLDLHNIIEESNARFIIEVDKCPTINFSRKNFRSIVYNLISNSIKYRSDSRPLTIKIICYEEDNYEVFQIEDNGLGINAQDRSKIFSMFKRFHSHVEGSGIGLYMVKKIIDNSRGKIEVSSEVGVGTTFKVYFKL
ncbi:MAG TPA: PAS domain-containing protein [Cytophagales bacterium]|nr:PAS domain-containing protein [Cytophagales bacterium]